MYKYAAVFAGLFSLAAVTASASAASLRTEFSNCVEKFANHNTTVTVMLECNANGGKLSDCKVLDDPKASQGFDNAAKCVARILPIGGKTGTIKVPILFQALH